MAVECWLTLSGSYCYRSSRPELFCEKGALRNFTKFTGKHLYQSLFFNKVAGLRPPTLLKKRLWQRCFPVRFVKFLRTRFFTEHLWWLLLLIILLDTLVTRPCERSSDKVKIYLNCHWRYNGFISKEAIYFSPFQNCLVIRLLWSSADWLQVYKI